MIEPYWQDDTCTLYLGKSEALLPDVATASVDAVVTDPPYEIGFMGRSWDASGVAYDPALWAEVLRVLKPGGHLLAFGGTRTYHRMVCAIEDAGFQIRDSLHWIYGSGFPKGQDIAKSVDRRRDDRSQVLQVTAWLLAARNAAGWTNRMLNDAFAHEGDRCSHWTTQGKAASYGPEPDVSQRRRGEAGVADLLVEEVEAPGTTRRCDLLRFGMWPSRGHRIIVHELKVSRSDWQRELDDPAKAEAWWPHCHEFWVVAPAGLIDPGEVPEGWGLMVPPANGRTRKFRVLKKAAGREPKITASLVAAILRRADNMRLSQIAKLNADRELLIDRAISKARHEIAAQKLSSSLQGRLELLEKLETALGARLDTFTWGGHGGGFQAIGPEELAAALREYTADHVSVQQRAADLRRDLERAAIGAARFVKAYEEIAEVAADA